MNCWSLLVLVALASTITYAQAAEYRRICLVNNWSQYRKPPATFFPNQTDPSLCSHIMFTYAHIDSNNNIIPHQWNDDIPGGLYEQTIALKEREKGLKVSISVGGQDFGMEQVTLMMATAANRSAFINSVIPFCRTRGFDGVDLDFRHPGSRGSPEGDKYRYTSLLEEFRTAINNEAASSGNPALLLTAAVAAQKTLIDAGYEVPIISQYLDFISVFTFAYNGPWDTITGLNAPLYPRADEFGVYYNGVERSTLNLNWSANYWVELGAPKEKLVLGIATYGRSFTLADPAENGLGAPVTGAGRPGNISSAGTLAYFEICIALQEGTNRIHSDEQKAPYIYKGDQWAGYDDEYSLELKVEYIVENCFSGWMAWSVDQDDFNGNLGCNAGPYPLLHRANEVLETTPKPTSCSTTASIPASTATTPIAPTTTTTTTTTTAAPTATTTTVEPFTCDGKPDGSYVNPNNCTTFFVCSRGLLTEWPCPSPLYYDDILHVCNWWNELSEERQEECESA